MRLALILGVVGSWFFVAVAAGQHGHNSVLHDPHTDSTAHEVETKANAVAWEMYTHYRAFPDYAEVYRECKEMWAISRHCHDLLHNRINNTRLRSNVQDLDNLFHHLEEHVAAWDHGHGSELRRRMSSLEAALHHLMLDAGVSARPTQAGGAVAPNASPGFAPPGNSVTPAPPPAPNVAPRDATTFNQARF